MRHTIEVTDAFAAALEDLDAEAFQLLYGRWVLEQLGHLSWARQVSQ